MEQTKKALNEVVETENSEVTTPVIEKETAEEVVESEASDEVEEETTETEKVQKKGYSQRVREVIKERDDAKAESQSLAEKLAKLTAVEPTADYQPLESQDEPLVQPGEEIDAVELDRRLRTREEKVLQRADALITLRGRQQEAVARINSEADEVMRLYPELNPEGETFNKELSEAISEATEAYVMKNPYSASVKSFVGKMMRPYKGAVSKEVGDMTESVVKQVSEAALRPTSIRGKEKPATEKSIAELEAQLGVVQA